MINIYKNPKVRPTKSMPGRPKLGRIMQFTADSRLKWFLNNGWLYFEVVAELDKLPSKATLIGHQVENDHLEELYRLGDRFFRFAGSGRGLYWTQELALIDFN